MSGTTTTVIRKDELLTLPEGDFIERNITPTLSFIRDYVGRNPDEFGERVFIEIRVITKAEAAL